MQTYHVYENKSSKHGGRRPGSGRPKSLHGKGYKRARANAEDYICQHIEQVTKVVVDAAITGDVPSAVAVLNIYNEQILPKLDEPQPNNKEIDDDELDAKAESGISSVD